jgi:hypothetical protein
MKQWLTAATLSIGMLLQTHVGMAAVREVKLIDTVATVFNFTVENTHTYFVGNEHILAHNDCTPEIKGELQHVLDYMDATTEKAFLNAYQNNATLRNKFINGVLSGDAYIS